METALYRFFDEAGVLLYVGIANDPRVRWSSHAGEKRWWPEVAAKSVEWFATRAEAESAEIAAIIGERPQYNVTHSDTRRPGDAKADNTERYRHLAKVRMLKSQWVRFGEAAAAAGTNRSAVLQQFMAWYIGTPGVECPQRPPAGPWSEVQGNGGDAERRVRPGPRVAGAAVERLAEVDAAATKLREARLELEAAVRAAREAGAPLTSISQRAGYSREWVRNVIDGTGAKQSA
ncbi:hypothetical protein CP979_05280 [Streptomyces filamentosus]|nr:hypothetical protein CP979_05280 [Streptomyces filamentosus]